MQTHQTKTEKTPLKDQFLRAVAVLGLIAVLLLGAWGIIQLAFAIPGVLGNLGGGVSSLFTHNATPVPASAKESVTVSVPATSASGQSLDISWTHTNADKNLKYSYAISYACQT